MSLRIEQTTIFNPPHPTTLVATISNLEGLLFFEGQILMQKHAVASGEWGREGEGGGHPKYNTFHKCDKCFNGEKML